MEDFMKKIFIVLSFIAAAFPLMARGNRAVENERLQPLVIQEQGAFSAGGWIPPATIN
jgi:hypothetical protein